MLSGGQDGQLKQLLLWMDVVLNKRTNKFGWMTEIVTLELFYWDSNYSKVSQWQVSDSDGLIQYSDG